MPKENQGQAISVEKLLQVIGQLTIEKQLMAEQLQALQLSESDKLQVNSDK